ncbi:MAG: efflux RND transporter permease subunit [Deltaproteobacteria bacterium]|nr:efflux RND transporter permease subunit [Deltaproteobacteria bacterium]
MTLADLSIKRPVFAWMIMAALIVFGAISFMRLGVSQMPDVDFPVLSVEVSWPGAAPEVMESEIADQIEQAVVAVEGIREMTSSIRQGSVNVSLEFDLDRDIDAALQEVQSAISRVRLPLEVDFPSVRKSNPEDQPIIWLGVSGERPLRDLIDYVDRQLKDQFQIIPGVGQIFLGGFTERNLRVWVDNAKLKRHELTILDVRDALQRGHLEEAAGRIENEAQELNLRMMGEGMTPEAVGEILITQRGGRPIFQSQIRIKDVARVEDALNDVRRISRINGIPGIGIGIRKQRGANAVAVGEAVKARMAELIPTLPPDIKMGINFDSTVFIEEAIEETEFTLLLSALVTGIVCWFFLGSITPTFNILLSIPTSIVGSFAVIYFMGFTLNLFTILGLTLAIGIVVDDAIMVLENIYRHRDLGKQRIRAAREGANEITFAAVAATVAVVAIFLPVAFMEGIIGKFFFQFGITITAAVLLSLLEAVTLIPMRCAAFMEPPGKSNFFQRFVNRCFARLGNVYRLLLRVVLKARILTLLVATVLFALSLTLSSKLRKEFIPPEDQSVFMMRFQTPVGSSLEFTSRTLDQAENIIKQQPFIKRYFAAVGGFGGGEVNTGIIFVTLVPPDERKMNQSEVMTFFRNELGKIPNLKVFVQDLSQRGFTARRGFPVELNIRGSNWDVLRDNADKIISKLEKTGLVVDLDTDYRLGQPEVRVWPLRDKAAARGVPIESISGTVAAAIGGIRQGKFTSDGRRYDMRIRLEGEERSKPEDILRLSVRNIHGELIPLTEVVRIEEVPTLQTITRRNRERSISITANVAPGASQAQALETAQKIARKILPEGYRSYLAGSATTFIESFESLIFVLWLGVVVAYMVLASQFNSFLHPITVLLALPFSVTGAFLALYLLDQSINLYSMIGIVLLMGIVKKNSILLVEFTNHKRYDDGLPVKEAILEAGPIRLRPILMTSAATIAAAIPPALALGPGAESRIPMAITVVGGVLVSTMFTLFVVPCAYSLLSAFERKPKED